MLAAMLSVLAGTVVLALVGKVLLIILIVVVLAIIGLITLVKKVL